MLGLGGGAFALRLRPTAATDTFVSSSSPEYRATQRFYDSFGEEPVEVLVKGNLQQLVLSSDIDRLLGLENCLAGALSPTELAQVGGARSACGQLASANTVKVVLGPATFINESATQIGSLIVQDARPVVILTTYDARVFTSVAKLKRLIAQGAVRYAFLNSYCSRHASTVNAACSAPAKWIRANGTDVSRQAGLSRPKVLWLLPGATP